MFAVICPNAAKCGDYCIHRDIHDRTVHCTTERGCPFCVPVNTKLSSEVLLAAKNCTFDRFLKRLQVIKHRPIKKASTKEG